MSGFAHPQRHHVAVLARDGLLPMELSLVHELFGKAGEAEGAPLYEVLTCAAEPGSLRTIADFAITVEAGPDVLAEADTVIVPAADEDYTTDSDTHLSPPLAAAFARIRPGTRIASICSGTFVLAAAGLLDGKRATTHWNGAERFRARHPQVELDPDVLYVDEGEVLTSAGGASGIDLCLHMIRCDHGSAVANQVARSLVVPPHRDGGQAQFIRRPVPEPAATGTGAARAWALQHLDRPLSLEDLAERAAMSVRTFTRRFRDEMGVAPRQWLIQQRTERARELLEETDLPIDRVAERAGFGTSASLRQHLQETLGVSPSAYRTTFRGPQQLPAR